jgi:DNA-binding beta-propeller fold protein YncE
MVRKIALDSVATPTPTPTPTIPTLTVQVAAGSLNYGDGTVNAFFGAPAGLVLDTANNILYVADSENNRIRTIDGSKVVNTLTGMSFTNSNRYRRYNITLWTCSRHSQRQTLRHINCFSCSIFG